jgi:hypothetical protein
VPTVADVPGIQPAVLVKAAPPTTLDASTENLFSGLIPDSRCGVWSFVQRHAADSANTAAAQPQQVL